MTTEYRIIGLMSGSSLDGLDLAYCTFRHDGKWHFTIENAICYPYEGELHELLEDSRNLGAADLWELHARLGAHFAGCVNRFIKKNELHGKVDAIASHGHTIFHYPERRFTCQIGDGAALSAKTHLPVICDFRSADVALGGQGTPIVPIADLLLFPETALLLNIGGIANISAKMDGSILAFDVCAANQLLNFFAQQKKLAYDDGGKLARKGTVHPELLNALNDDPYFEQPFPKSLDNGFSKKMLQETEYFSVTTEDQLATCCEHIAMQIAQHIEMIEEETGRNFDASQTMLVTGGGAFNTYLMERIASRVKVRLAVPDEQIVKYKEALAIAFMGVLFERGEPNVLRSVTGASANSIGGCRYGTKLNSQ